VGVRVCNDGGKSPSNLITALLSSILLRDVWADEVFTVVKSTVFKSVAFIIV
jgi:hypothetical protein